MVSAVVHASSSENQEYMMFLKKYEDLSNQVNIEGLEMYADDAKIHSREITSDGIERTTSMSGKKLKELNMENLEIIKRLPSQISFTNIKIKKNKNTAKLTASKYSTRNCFTDNEYYMVITKKADNKLYITEENMTIPSENQCKKGIKDDLALQLALNVSMMKKNLPKQVDQETVLEDMLAKDKELTIVFRLIHFTPHDFPSEMIEINIVPEIIKNVCKENKMKELLEKDGTIKLKYYFSDQTLATEIKMDKHECRI